MFFLKAVGKNVHRRCDNVLNIQWKYDIATIIHVYILTFAGRDLEWSETLYESQFCTLWVLCHNCVPDRVPLTNCETNKTIVIIFLVVGGGGLYTEVQPLYIYGDYPWDFTVFEESSFWLTAVPWGTYTMSRLK